MEVVARERLVLAAHRENLRGSAFPPAHAAQAHDGTFLHGFLLPFSLLVATLRHRELGARLLWVVVGRALAVAAVSYVVFQSVHAPDLEGQASWRLVLAHRWAWVVWFVSALSMTEAAIAHLSRRYDDHLAFHVAMIARIHPENPVLLAPALSLGLGELLGKGKRWVRGYCILGTCFPIVLLFAMLPSVGDLLAGVALFSLTTYWFAVFSAGKSRHAYADEAFAPPPRVFRDLDAHAASVRWLAPLSLYTRLAKRVVRSANAPAMVFERNPAGFLGLALARVVLSLPGLYSLSRPVISVAAGRLCAESDPGRRFSL